MFLDSRTDSRTVGAALARGMDLPHASRQVFLDNDLDADTITGQLAELERVARRRGYAIAIGHPHDVTVDVLARWIPEARARGFDLVPVSAIVKLEYGAGNQLAAATGGGKTDGFLGGTQ
ncbi:MAG: divergent polysaccharide deacetylase family protein, partial [Alphaproteobacteria bacterium]|nr:divergent polysaccharide deacetylase family protein [Alphaproteobacteria bacterium]